MRASLHADDPIAADALVERIIVSKLPYTDQPASPHDSAPSVAGSAPPPVTSQSARPDASGDWMPPSDAVDDEWAAEAQQSALLNMLDADKATADVEKVDPQRTPRRTPKKRALPGVAGLVASVDRRSLGVVAALIIGGLFLAFAAWLAISSTLGGTDTRDAASVEEPAGVSNMSKVKFNGQTFPSSEVAGPSVLSDTRASGWQQSDVGSALSAAYLSAGSSAQVGPGVFEATIREQVTGPSAAELLQVRQSEYQQWAPITKTAPGAPIDVSTQAATLTGWKVDNWSQSGPITVHLLAQRPSKDFFEYAALVEWDTAVGDYKLVAPAGGKFASAAVPDTSPYTPFYTTS